MGHNLEQLGTASLDTMGGLFTQANPQDLPEGASPRNYNVDYITGSVKTRPGLSSVYVYVATLNITAVTLYNSVGTFSYIGKTPSLNESFTLSGFTGTLSFLNGQSVTVISVNTLLNTFVADVVGGPSFGTFTGLTGIANSEEGNFLGPNAPTVASVVSTGGNPWSNPNNILGSVGYASVTSTASGNVEQVPPIGANTAVGALPQWNTPSNIGATGATRTFVSLTPSAPVSTQLLALGTTFSLPSDATVTGVVVSLSAYCSVAAVGSLSVQLANANTDTPIGTALTFPLSTSAAPYIKGSSSYQWGTTLTPTTVNGSELGVFVKAQVSSGSATFYANSMTVTVYYTAASDTEELQTKTYAFSVPSTAGISGFGVTFQAYSSSASSLVFQMLKNGLPVGTPHTQVLTTTPTVYTVGAANDLWGSTWAYSDVNNTQFGVEVSGGGNGTSFINDLDIITYILPAQVDFNYIKTYEQNNTDINTLALDASGLLWQENVTDSPGTLSIALSGILPGSYAKSATADDQEYIMFSNLTVGTDRPRVASINNVTNQLQFMPLSAVGPGAPPTFGSNTGNTANNLILTSYAINNTGSASAPVWVGTFSYTGTEPSAGQVFVLGLVSGSAGSLPSNMQGVSVTVLSSGLGPTSFEASFPVASAGVAGYNPPNNAAVANTALNPNGYATARFSYAISTITQNPAQSLGVGVSGHGYFLWSAGPGNTSPGTTITVYFRSSNGGAPSDNTLLNLWATGVPVYVYITNSPLADGAGNGTWLVTSVQGGFVPTVSGAGYFYFTFTYTSSAYQLAQTSTATYQITQATVTTTTPIPDAEANDQITITGSSVGNWDGNWTIVQPLTGGLYNITSTAMSANGTATYTYNNAGTTTNPVAAGEIISIQGCTNSAVFNGIFVVSTGGAGTFTIAGFTNYGNISATPVPETSATGETFGQSFSFDPGSLTVGTTQDPIYGNATGGSVVIVGGVLQPIGAGTRQGAVFFIYESGYWTTPSPLIPAATFTTSADSNYINVTNIPIGPPGVVARGIAFTEAGQNGVAGANFYVIENPVTITVSGVTSTYSSTIIRDNQTSSSSFTFTDEVLLNSTEIDTQGFDLFNEIELGSSAWVVPYADRNFYGLQLNKVQNFNNLTFDGGYLYGINQPLGWNILNAQQQVLGIPTLISSPVTGQALYIKNTTAAIIPYAGLVYQSAYQDAEQVAIIRPNTTYSVRVAASNPSGIPVGTLVIGLQGYTTTSGFNQTPYGIFEVPLSDMTTNVQIFTGTLLTVPFTGIGGVPANIVLSAYVGNLGINADCLIDRIEVFPTQEPYILAQVYGSYANDLEAIDATSEGGIIDTSSENAQACLGGFVMHDELYLLKTNSWYATQDNPNSEPGGWSLREISNKVGTCGILAYDTGEEWAVTACRQGIFGFNGGQPVKIMQELWNLWETINWEAGNTIWLRNDIVNKRILCGVPLPTGTNPSTGAATATTQWLPFSPYNPTPTSPNVILMLNYQAFATFDELISGPPVHSTMFGTLAAPDMRRKWSIWQIPSPYSDFITRQDGLDMPLFICNGIDSSKIYQLLDSQKSDDGVAIDSLYCTYGFVSSTKATTIPIFGMHRKLYSVFQTTMEGQGTASVTLYPDNLMAKYPITIPGGIALSTPTNQDYFRPLNVTGNRVFVEIETDAVGSWFSLDRIMLTGRSAPWSSLNPTGGGSRGIIAGAP